MTETRSALLSGRLLARNAGLNFASVAIPTLMGLVAIPLLIAGMGVERFGVLAMIWVGAGYFALFDIGTGQALTQALAERLGSGKTSDLGQLIWAALAVTCCIVAVVAALVFFGTATLVDRVLDVAPELRDEAIGAVRIFALAIPVIALTKLPVGLLAAHQRFDTLAAIRIPIGVLRFASPLVTLLFTPSLVPATAVLMSTRLLTLIFMSVAASRVEPAFGRPARPTAEALRSLLHFGGWLTVLQIVRPLLTYFDRFIVGATLGVGMLTYYITPFEVLARVRLLPQSLVAVLFPAFATTVAADPARVPRLYSRMARVLLLILLPATSAVFLLAPEALQYWLGTDFRLASAPVAYWLAVGWTVSMQSRPAATYLQGSGRPDLLAKATMAMLLPYMGLSWWMTASHGITGTATAWFLVVLADTIVLNGIARYTNPELSSAVKGSYLTTAGVLAGFSLAWLVRPVWARALLWIVVALVCAALLLPLISRLVGRPKVGGQPS